MVSEKEFNLDANVSFRASLRVGGGRSSGCGAFWLQVLGVGLTGMEGEGERGNFRIVKAKAP